MMEQTTIGQNPFTLAPHSPEKFGYLAAFDIQRWYGPHEEAREDELADLGFTLRSRFVSLTVDDARVLSDEHERVRREDEPLHQHEHHASSTVERLAAQVQHLITHPFHGRPVFVRLSTQSPKDVGRGWTEHPEVGTILREEAGATESHGRTLNDRIRALFSTSLRLMKVRTGREALDLLIKSDRIHSSVQHALANKDRSPWDLSIVVREWHEDMRLDNEFRTFVVRNRLVAISQYNEYCHYPAWDGKESLITEKILRLFADRGVRDKLPRVYKDWAYVVDFLVPNDEDSEAIMVEVNPFGPGTGASLFDWKRERRLLQDGQDVWGDLNSASSSTEEGGEEEGADRSLWTRTTCLAGGEGEVHVRLATRQRPDIDSSFLSSFGIDILLPSSDLDSGDDDDDEEGEEKEEDEEEEENKDISGFVDEFVTEVRLRPIVRDACGGRYAKRWTKSFVSSAVQAILHDQQARAWLSDRGVEWSDPLLERAVARGAQQWYAYSIATRG